MINLLESKDLLYLKTRLVNHETKYRCKKKEGKRESVLAITIRLYVEHNTYLYLIIMLYLFTLDYSYWIQSQYIFFFYKCFLDYSNWFQLN